MPLSEQEQRLLDEMERNLYQNDADLVATVGARRGRANYRAIVLGAILVVAGIVTLLIGVGSRLSLVGVLGFVLMLGGVLLAVTPSRSSRRVADAPVSGGPRRSPGFMGGLNDRWERRQGGDN